MPKKASLLIKEIVDSESEKISNSFSGPSYHAIQHILRRLDFIMLFFTKAPGKTEEEELREFYNYGWAPAIKPFYEDLDININESFPEMFKQARDWADATIQFAGKLEFLNQLIAYEKADLIEIDNPKQNEFSFRYIVERAGLEQYDKKSKDFFRDMIIERMINEEMKDDDFDEEAIKKKLRQIIRNPKGKYISYDATPDIDEYYNKKGHYFLRRLIGFDDFDDNDKFGGIEYWKYLELVETIIGVSIMHTEASIELSKMNPEVDMHNLLTYTYFKDKTVDVYRNYFGATKEEIEQIFSCISLNKENFDYYLKYPSASLPMYVEASNDMLIRLASGCLGNPFELLHRELKRKFNKDYFQAVNNREERFRNQLFMLFPHENILKLPKGVVINIDGRKTDIDAILFDTKTMTLGLFQLKWQDSFYKSMKERFSRISNLFGKANEWIEKVEYWLNNMERKNILSSLKINKHYKGTDKLFLNEVHIFVLSRNNINFTNIENLDERVAWGTWYQMIESQATVKVELGNPIREAFIKLKTLSPEMRMEREELPELPDFEMQVGNYKVYHKKEKKPAANKG